MINWVDGSILPEGVQEALNKTRRVDKLVKV